MKWFWLDRVVFRKMARFYAVGIFALREKYILIYGFSLAIGIVLFTASGIIYNLTGWNAWPIRISALFYWFIIAFLLISLPRNGNPALLSPLFLLGSIALWAFILMPATYRAVVMDVVGVVVPAVGWPAELMVLRFAFVLLAIAPAACRTRPQEDWAKSSLGFSPRYLVVGFALSGFVLATFLVPTITGHGLRAVLTPAIFVCLAGLAFEARSSRDGGAGKFWLLASVAAPAMLHDNAKIFVIFLAVGGLLVTSRTQIRRRSVGVVALGAILTLGFLTFYAERVKEFEGSITFHDLKQAAAYKLVYRQAETLGCLGSVLADRSRADPENFHLGPFYFVESIVPRLFWPAKPNLSRGHEFAVAFCGFPKTSDIGQSASVTLLGEPIIQAGIPGLLVFGTFLTVTLFLLSRLWVRHGWSAICILAMYPWLVDFDQLAALYVGNVVKFGLIAVITAVAFAHIGTKRSR